MQNKFLIGMTLEEIIKNTEDLNLPRYIAREIAMWIYQKAATDINQFTNISIKQRELLKGRFGIGITPYEKVSTSTDGTKKYLFPALENRFIETAYIPELKRHTLCVSSQVGCKFGCLFCMTAKQGFQGHLDSNQIINQILSIPEREKITNIVFMGMGEPFDNTDEVLKSLEILTADYCLNLNPKKITVSTVGIIPGMKQFIEHSRCQLALSLHSPFDEERAMLMPVENIYPLKEVIETIKSFSIEKRRNVSIEYILFKGLNDSDSHVNQLARVLNGLKCKINLIRFHKIPDSPLEGTSGEALIDFRDKLNKKGIQATIRASRGEDILAACGLLSTKEIEKK